MNTRALLEMLFPDQSLAFLVALDPSLGVQGLPPHITVSEGSRLGLGFDPWPVRNMHRMTANLPRFNRDDFAVTVSFDTLARLTIPYAAILEVIIRFPEPGQSYTSVLGPLSVETRKLPAAKPERPTLRLVTDEPEDDA